MVGMKTLVGPDRRVRFDAETGTHYNYYRDFDPSTGRYIQSDPIGLYGGLNTYGYVAANPLSLIDPTGTVAGAGAIVPGLLICGVGCYLTPGCKAAVENTVRSLLSSASSASSGSGSGSSGNVVPFPGKKDDKKSCEKDDCDDPCTELLALLKLRMLQLLKLAGSGANMAFEIRQYEIARAEFCKVCPSMCSQAPRVPDVLKK